MKRLKVTLFFICLCLLGLSACKTSHHATGKHNKKKHKKNCNCPKFSHQDSYPEHTYIVQTT